MVSDRLKWAIALPLGVLLLTVARPAAADLPAPVAVDATSYPSIAVTLGLSEATAGGVVAPTDIQIGDGRTTSPAASVTKLSGNDLHVLLVFDTSGSMAGTPIAEAKVAAQRFVGELPPTASIGVIGFSATPRVVRSLSTDHAAVAAAIGSLTASGETSLYDAVDLAAGQLAQTPGGRSEIVLLSDGGDTVSHATLDGAAQAVSADHVRVDVASLLTSDTNAGALARLAAAGGGTVVPAAAPQALGSVYDQLAATLLNQYRVQFTTSDHGPVVFTVDFRGAPVTQFGLALPAAAPPPPAARPGARAVAPRRFLPDVPLPLLVGAAAVFAALVIGVAWALWPRPGRRMRLRLAPRQMQQATADKVNGVGAWLTTKADQALDSRGKRRSLAELLDQAGIALQPGEFLVLTFIGVAVGGGGGTLVAGPLLGLLLAFVVGAAAYGVVRFRVDRRRKKFADQLVDTLQLLANTLRTGYGVQQAITSVADQADWPTNDEFRRVVAETRLGRDLPESLAGVADRAGSEDFRWVVQAVAIQREVGGDLAGILDTVTETIREREKLRRHIKALSAEGRLSAYVLIGLPFGVAFFVHVTNPQYLEPLFHGKGRLLLVVGAGLMGSGALWLKKLCRIAV